jgi:hypothetical protein
MAGLQGLYNTRIRNDSGECVLSLTPSDPASTPTPWALLPLPLPRLRAATHFIMQSEKLAAASFLRDLSRKDVIRGDLR